MEIRRNEFPVTLQAFDVRNSKEEFLAEQVVHSQPEVDRFTAQFNGKLIKAHAMRPEEARKAYERGPKTRTMSGWAVFLVILIVLLVVAYFTGWLQPFINSIKN